ncbi:MAG: hypothetical protein PHE56_03820 [Bacteroidales bacterium]|nr:hypothetical protein [Bacteroidales bacterium]
MTTNFRKISLQIFFAFLMQCFISSSFAQITVPINEKELEDYAREREAMSAMKIDLSQTWLYMVKDNVISSNKLLLQEVYYSKLGTVETVVNYNENRNITNFKKIKYNNKNLPFEEIRFSSDSSLLGGVMFEYYENGLLKKQTDYDENATVTVMQEYVRSNDTIFVNVYDGKGAFVYRNIMLTETVSGTSLIKAMYKVDRNNNILETTILEYDQLLSLRRKMIYDDKNKGTKREFVYDDEGALLRSVTYNENNEIISDSSYEYDKYGNVIRIIEFDKETSSTKLYFINYLSKRD